MPALAGPRKGNTSIFLKPTLRHQPAKSAPVKSNA
jgi:hypothetical protein